MAMRFRAHETFFIRKGWLSKGMKYVSQNPSVFVDSENKATDVLGIGSNMVKSLRYWLQVTGLTTEPNKGKRLQSFTELGKSIFENDRYIEEAGTLCLLQYKIASSKEDATAWYYFFNEFNMSEFTKEDFVASLNNYVLMENGTAATRSLTEDFNCIVGTYLPRYKSNPTKISPESNIDCPLGELGLIDVFNKSKKSFKKSMPAVEFINPLVALAIIVDNANRRTEIGLNELLNAPCNIGKIFNLDAIVMLELLRRIEKIGELKIIRTAGLDVVRILNNRTFQDCVNEYYETIKR